MNNFLLLEKKTGDAQTILLDFSMAFTISAQGTTISDKIQKVQVKH